MGLPPNKPTNPGGIDTPTPPVGPSQAEQALDAEVGYTLQVLNLIAVAQDIRAGQAEQLATRIEEMLPAYLGVMKSFQETPYRTVAYHTAGRHFERVNRPLPIALRAIVKRAHVKVPQVLSAECYAEIRCVPPKGCVPWPTSLRPVDIDMLDPMGWRYIVDSHCGFTWPQFWKLSCGAPLGLVACTGTLG